MTENEFLEVVSYSTDKAKKELIVWYHNDILATLSFENHPHLLNDGEYCKDLMITVALESSAAEKYIDE